MLNKRTTLLMGIGVVFATLSVFALCFGYKLSFCSIVKEALLAVVTGAVFAIPSALLLLAHQNETGKQEKRETLIQLEKELENIEQNIKEGKMENYSMEILHGCSERLSGILSDYCCFPKEKKEIHILKSYLLTLESNYTQGKAAAEGGKEDHERENYPSVLQNAKRQVEELLRIEKHGKQKENEAPGKKHTP